VDFWNRSHLSINCCPAEIKYSCKSFQLRSSTPQALNFRGYSAQRARWHAQEETLERDKATRAKMKSSKIPKK